MSNNNANNTNTPSILNKLSAAIRASYLGEVATAAVGDWRQNWQDLKRYWRYFRLTQHIDFPSRVIYLRKFCKTILMLLLLPFVSVLAVVCLSILKIFDITYGAFRHLLSASAPSDPTP